MSLPDSDRWKALDSLLDEALELEEEGRVALLTRLRTEDPALATELGELLAGLSHAGPLDEPVASLFGDDALEAEPGSDALAVGRRVGPYRIVAVLGRGGMGTVYRAERDDGAYEGSVAIKILRWEMATPEAVERFRLERQLLARLDHPGIARLVDGGITDEGLPYLAMELVHGAPLDTFCAEHALSCRDRIRLLLDVCRIVSHAHRALVVHRDLKPSNVLVTDGGAIKLLDFGVAKVVSAEVTHTLESAPLTPAYAAPEQLSGQPITTATDVYGLGVLACELLTGSRPHEGDAADRASVARRIVAEDPPLPSDLARASPEEAPTRPSELAGDLDAIVVRALARDPADRYGTAAELGDDLERWLEHRPVTARAGGAAYRFRRLVRRRRVGVTVAASVTLALTIGLAAAWSQARQASRARSAALAEAERAARVADVMASLFELADPFDGAAAGSITARELLDQGAERVRTRLAADTVTLVGALVAIADGYRRIGAFAEGTEVIEPALEMARQTGDPLLISDAMASFGRLRGAHTEESIELFSEALALRDAALPAPDVKTAELLGDLTQAWLRLEDAERADATNRRRRTVLERIFAEGAPELLEPMLEDARIARVRGDLTDAAGLYQSWLDEADGVVPPASELWPQAYNNLAFVQRATNDLDGAVATYSAALAHLVETAGPAHTSAVLVRTNLASVHLAAGRGETAESLLVENVELLEAEDDPRREEAALANLGGLYIVSERPDRAVEVFRRELDVSSQMIPANPAVTSIARVRLALALELSGAEEEATQEWRVVERELQALGGLNFAALAVLDWAAGRLEAGGAIERSGWLRALRDEAAREAARTG